MPASEQAAASDGVRPFPKEGAMEFLVEFEVDVPEGTPESEVRDRERADNEAQLDGLLRALPLYEWMHITVTPLEAHPNDPATAPASRASSSASPAARPQA
jgi:muconolactone delta-isomerase